MPTTCVVTGCRSGYKTESVSEIRHFFSPPTDPVLFEKWNRATHRKNFVLKPNHKVCDLHFDESFIIKSDKFIINNETVEMPRGKWTLRVGAVPHIFPNLPLYLSKEHKIRKSLIRHARNDTIKNKEPSDIENIPDQLHNVRIPSTSKINTDYHKLLHENKLLKKS